MPGASLWIIPPTSSFNDFLQTLITDTIPSLFPEATTHSFIPHITITSNVDQSIYDDQKDPQAWLDSLHLEHHEAQDIKILLADLEPGHPFFKKLTLNVVEDDPLLRLVAACRMEAVVGYDIINATWWAEGEYLPHLSLMYAEMRASHVEKHLPAVLNAILDGADGFYHTADGGKLVLVDTSKPIRDWTVMAERNLPRLHWHWAVPRLP